MYDIKEIGMIPPPYGGVSVYLKRLIKKLNQDGFSVGGYYISTEDKAVRESPLFDKWSWFETSKFPWKIFKYLFQLRKYRIIHSHMGLEAMPYLWTLKLVLKKKVIITVHNAMVSNFFQETNKINAFFLRRMAMEKDVAWIAVSEEGKKQMEELPVRFSTPIHIVPAYIPELDSSSVLSAPIVDYLNSHKHNLAFYGHSFMRNKGEDVYGFKEMIAVYKHVLKEAPDVGLVYCMADVSDSKAVVELEFFAQKLGIADRMYWQYGSIPSLQPLWDRVDVYVRPTSTDGDSVAVREAIASGAQVVATDVVKRPSGCVIYHQGNVEEAAQTIIKTLLVGRHPSMRDSAQYELMREIYRQLL